MTISTHLLARRRREQDRLRRSPLQLYWQAARLRRQARAWLRGDDPNRIAAHCMYHLNHAAWANEKFQPVYKAKNHLVRLFYYFGFCRSVRIHTQTLNCWECGGSGDDGHGAGTCWKCGGTGIYRQHLLYAFRFDVNGRTYTWHQPKDLVTWPVPPDFAPITEYEPRPSHQRFSLGMPLPILELYAVTVNEYLVRQGIDRKDLPAYGPRSLVQALQSTWRLSKLANRLRRFRWKMRQVPGRVRHALSTARRLWQFAETGEMPTPAAPQAPGLDDELPF